MLFRTRNSLEKKKKKKLQKKNFSFQKTYCNSEFFTFKKISNSPPRNFT